ncbi:MAG: glycosyltransferase [Actinomycetota bacterium]|nr:glycosyltransferase [Actinomycetota bacterium]
MDGREPFGGQGVSGQGLRSSMTATVDIVVPTIGRPSLEVLIESLFSQVGALPESVVVVDDRRNPSEPLSVVPPAGEARVPVKVVASGGRGPAAARNVGWRAGSADWVEFLDDDVVLPPGWLEALWGDLSVGEPDGPPAGGSQGRIRVPLPSDRRPTDWERNVAALESARWATADMAYRREVLEVLGGFDERFPRAFREDADLALRAKEVGVRLVVGERHVRHPVRPASRWVSVRLQRGNRDDALMGAIHGPGWRDRAEAPRGAIALHATTTASAAAALAFATSRCPRGTALGLAGWVAGTFAFAVHRMAPGPRDFTELGTMLTTSVLIPPVAVWHRVAGEVRWAGTRLARMRRLRVEGGMRSGGSAALEAVAGGPLVLRGPGGPSSLPSLAGHVETDLQRTDPEPLRSRERT